MVVQQSDFFHQTAEYHHEKDRNGFYGDGFGDGLGCGRLRRVELEALADELAGVQVDDGALAQLLRGKAGLFLGDYHRTHRRRQAFDGAAVIFRIEEVR